MPEIGAPVRQSVRVLGVYLRGQILLSLILGVLYCAAFWFVQAPYWWLIGMIGGLVAIVPKLGSLVPLGLVMLALYADSAEIKRFLIALGLWLVIQVFSFVVLVPRLLHRPLGLSELPVIVAVLAASLFFGPIGIVFAVPVLAIGLVFWRYFRKSAQREG